MSEHLTKRCSSSNFVLYRVISLTVSHEILELSSLSFVYWDNENLASRPTEVPTIFASILSFMPASVSPAPSLSQSLPEPTPAVSFWNPPPDF